MNLTLVCVVFVAIVPVKPKKSYVSVCVKLAEALLIVIVASLPMSAALQLTLLALGIVVSVKLASLLISPALILVSIHVFADTLPVPSLLCETVNVSSKIVTVVFAGNVYSTLPDEPLNT